MTQLEIKEREFKFTKEEIESLLTQCKEKLKYDERSILVWRGIEKKSFEEIAETLNISVQAVSQRYINMIKKLTNKKTYGKKIKRKKGQKNKKR
jgi:RNA polymerase sigma factor (sigma-70 family)